jgi:hypothetical protein
LLGKKEFNLFASPKNNLYNPKSTLKSMVGNLNNTLSFGVIISAINNKNTLFLAYAQERTWFNTLEFNIIIITAKT